jgi:hypothetical protein
VGNPVLEIVNANIFLAHHYGWYVTGTHGPSGESVYVVTPDLAIWVEKQPIYMWKHYDHGPVEGLNYYLLSEELLSWMILRWS